MKRLPQSEHRADNQSGTREQGTAVFGYGHNGLILGLALISN